MSFAEDQAMEMEALEAIFMQDLHVIATEPRHKFSIWIVPHSDDSQINHGKKILLFHSLTFDKLL
jgi:hypothetical protein